MNTATAKQINLINSLKDSRDYAGTEAEAALGLSRRLWALGEFTTKSASAVIDALMSAPKRETPAVEAPEGMHKVGDAIYKVQRAVHGSGNLYAKVLEEDGDGGWRFEYAPGAIRRLSEETKMTLEEAKAFGALYGTCCVCGRTLTNEESVAAGIGPVCAGRF